MTVAGSCFLRIGQLFQRHHLAEAVRKPGVNRLNVGAPIVIPAAMLDRWDGPAVIATGTVWPRNAMQGLPLKKVDLRATTRIALVNNVRVELLAEVFNVFYWKNYGNYTTLLTSPNFGQPVATSGNAYVPREGQLGVRVQF